MAGKTFTPQDVSHIAALAHIPATSEEEKVIAEGFNTTIRVVEQLFTVNVAGVEPTHHVAKRENVFREDEVDTACMLSQEAALANAPRSHNGFFVVDQIREEK